MKPDNLRNITLKNKNMAKTRKKLHLLKPTSKSILLLAAVIAVGLGTYYFLLRPDRSALVDLQDPKPGESFVNLEPATAQERQETEDHKKSLAEEMNKPPSQTSHQQTESGKKHVIPVISSVSSDSIRAYVPGIFEEGGICTATLTNANTSQIITKTSSGFKNVSNTNCEPIALGPLAAGKWNVVVSYSSNNSAGSSSSRELEVK